MAQQDIIIGLTGSFGSGCTEAAEWFITKGFDIFSLTEYIKDECTKRGILHPDREDLQNVGDELRKTRGNDYLVQKLLKILEANKLSSELLPQQNKKFVVKSIRNNYEVDKLRNKFGDSFYLINIDAKKSIRFERNKDKYTGDNDRRKRDFKKEDRRDSGENQPEYGQQVRKCVDEADIVINNNKDLENFNSRLEKYISIIENSKKYPPGPMESDMTEAVVESLKSGCRHRKVGAVIKKDRATISSGYNGSPGKTALCTSLSYCYRDFMEICKDCQTPLQITMTKCIKCKKEVAIEQREVLKKHLDLCQAIHAEERAILQVSRLGGNSLKDCTLYTTLFPCLLCAKMIVEVGIREVIFIDPYPYENALIVLRKGNVEVTKFEGIKAKNFFRFFGDSKKA